MTTLMLLWLASQSAHNCRATTELIFDGLREEFPGVFFYSDSQHSVATITVEAKDANGDRFAGDEWETVVEYVNPNYCGEVYSLPRCNCLWRARITGYAAGYPKFKFRGVAVGP